MRPSRGMGDINPSKMPGKKTIKRKDDPDKVEMYAGGGLYANIAAKKRRIAAGSGEKMRSVGSKGAPKKSDFQMLRKLPNTKRVARLIKLVTIRNLVCVRLYLIVLKHRLLIVRQRVNGQREKRNS